MPLGSGLPEGTEDAQAAQHTQAEAAVWLVALSLQPHHVSLQPPDYRTDQTASSSLSVKDAEAR